MWKTFTATTTAFLATMSMTKVYAAPTSTSAFVNGMHIVKPTVENFPPGIDGILYGFPDSKIGGLIVEGPFPYHNGPAVWNGGKDPWGAYGLISAAGKFDKQRKQCTPVPPNSPFAKSKLKAVPLTNGASLCMIGCDLQEVNATGVDPCGIGSIDGPTNSPMSCFDVGPGFAGGFGVCGYNCTALHPKEQVPCYNASDIQECNIYCDTRKFPPATNVTLSLL